MASLPHALVTIAAPLPVGRLDEARSLIGALGNPARPDVAESLDRLDGDDGIHFASLHAIAPTDTTSRTGHIVLEFSADGTEDAAVSRIADRIGEALTPIFALASDRGGGDLAAYFRGHRLKLGSGWTGRTGLAFAGTPGLSVGRIRAEAELARHLTAKLEAGLGGLTAQQRLAALRQEIRDEAAFAWALQDPGPLPPTPNPSQLGLLLGIGGSFAATYLWPVAILILVVTAFGVAHGWDGFWDAVMADPMPNQLWTFVHELWGALLWFLSVLCAFAAPLLVFAAWLYLDLRKREVTDPTDDRAPSRAVMHEILARENHLAHNHMVSITQRKSGLTRRLTTRLAFWLIAALATRQFKPGRLGDIGTIHFARWVMLPGGRDFVFFSNFGGSWESYLEDFIIKAHDGLTAVWSNSVGFPRSENLFQKGATDGERFKRFARHSMTPTLFWHSSYPTLTTDNIRGNATIRLGLATAETDEEAKSWLALFGSAERPAVKLESDQIQSLVFGGLGFMPYGEILAVTLADDRAAVRGWLGDIAPDVAFDDGRRLGRDAVVTLALGPGAMAKAGLPPSALETFPVAFQDGMNGPGRARILGDDPVGAPWWWGTRTQDVALLVYGVSQDAVDALGRALRNRIVDRGHSLDAVLPLRPVPDHPHEPFGFLDGVSQPVIRGTYRGLRYGDPIHLVEPGEFILGYPDNRGNLPPGPTLDAADDPQGALPIRHPYPGQPAPFGDNLAKAPREIGRNCSFLVIRQLEQDTDAFWAYCEAQASALDGRLPPPYVISKDFVAAKLVGRWPNGSSLVRNPYEPSDPLKASPTSRPQSNPDGAAAIAPPSADKTAAGSARYRDHGDNDFLFGTEDPQGLRCPYGAHIRRANPRDSLDPGSKDQIDITNRHRIIRVGRGYAPQDGQKPGLMFMCLNGDLERQFEFVQQTWLGSETFHGLSGERDPLAGDPMGCPIGYTVPTRDGPARLARMSRFVTPRGGGYFFLPSKTLLAFLSE